MATEIIHSVGTAGAPTRDYSSLSAWESAQQRDLVSADEIAIAECYNDGLMTNSPTISGWVTDTTRYIKIYTPDAERHDGTGTVGFKLFGKIEIRNPNVWTQGLIIARSSADTIIVDINVGTGWLKFEKNIVVGRRMDIEDSPSGVTIYIWNSTYIARASTVLGIQVRADCDSPVFIYNVSIYVAGAGDWGIQIDPSTDVTCKNVAVLSSAFTKDFEYTADFNANSDYNASSQDDVNIWRAPGANSLFDLVAANEYISIGGQDLHTPIGSNLYGAGIDLSADPNLAFSDDIDSDVRTEWSIGADDGTIVSKTDTFTLDAIIVSRNIDTFTIDAVIRSEKTDTFTFDTIIVSRNTDTFTIDAIVVEQNTDTFTIDVTIVESSDNTFTFDTIIVSRNTDTFTIDAEIVSRKTIIFTLDTILVEEILTDLDHQVVIYENYIMDVDHQVKIKYPVPAPTFQVRKPGIETLNYTPRVMGVGTISRKLEHEYGVSQSSTCTILVHNSDGKLSYLSTDGDYYGGHRYLWVWARVKCGWGKELDEDVQSQYQGKVEELILMEARSCTLKLTDVLRELLDDKIASAITFNSALVASTNLQSLNPIHIAEYLITDVLGLTVFNIDTEINEDPCDEDSFDEAYLNCADVVVNTTVWEANSSVIEMIQGALKLVGGWLYTGRDGKFYAKVYSPFDIPDSPKEFIGDETDDNRNIMRMKLNPSRRTIINSVLWTYGQSNTKYGPINDGSTPSSYARYGRQQLSLVTKWEIETSILDTIAERIMARYHEPVNRITFQSSNLSEGTGLNLELGEVFKVSDTAVGITDKYFLCYEKQENLLDRWTQIVAEDIEGLDGKFMMASSEIDEGDGKGITADNFDLWVDGYGFAGQADSTDPHYDGEPYPGFDEDGNQNGVINPDYGTQDYHNNGIEENFVAW